MTARDNGRFHEFIFIVGTLVGMLAFALGLAFLVLALTVGVREGTYLTGSQDLALGIGGAIVGALGLVLRAASERVPDRYHGAARVGGALLFLVGLMGTLFALSAEVTVSAPFLASPREKAILFVTAFVFVIAGLAITRAAGRAVGW